VGPAGPTWRKNALEGPPVRDVPKWLHAVDEMDGYLSESWVDGTVSASFLVVALQGSRGLVDLGHDACLIGDEAPVVCTFVVESRHGDIFTQGCARIV
jgi:hypothetical protein